MSVTRKILLTVMCLSFVFVSNGPEQAFGQTVVKTDFGDGVLDKSSAAMEKLLQLKWNGRNLELKRGWEKQVKKKKKKGRNKGDEELEKTIAKLVERGLPEADARLMAKQLADNGELGAMRNFGMGMNRSEVEKAFLAVASEFGSSSRGSSGDGLSKRLSFSGRSLSGRAIIANDDLEFEFSEVQGRERSFKIKDNGKGRFEFQFSFDNLFIRLLQTKNGKTQLIWITDDRVEVFVGDSFSNFTKRNPEVVDEMLFPLLKRLGIKTPVDVPDP